MPSTSHGMTAKGPAMVDTNTSTSQLFHLLRCHGDLRLGEREHLEENLIIWNGKKSDLHRSSTVSTVNGPFQKKKQRYGNVYIPHDSPWQFHFSFSKMALHTCGNILSALQEFEEDKRRWCCYLYYFQLEQFDVIFDVFLAMAPNSGPITVNSKNDQ